MHWRSNLNLLIVILVFIQASPTFDSSTETVPHCSFCLTNDIVRKRSRVSTCDVRFTATFSLRCNDISQLFFIITKHCANGNFNPNPNLTLTQTLTVVLIGVIKSLFWRAIFPYSPTTAVHITLNSATRRRCWNQKSTRFLLLFRLQFNSTPTVLFPRHS